MRYHTATLWAYYCMCWLMSLTTLSLTQCYLFIHSFQLEFPNLDFFIPCRSLYRKLWFKLLKFKNPISYGHATRFLLHVVAHVSQYVVFYTTLPYLFIHSSQLEFPNLDFFIPCRSLNCKLWFKLENPISYGHAMSFLMHVVAHVSIYVVFYTTLPYLFIHTSQLEFQNLVFFHPMS